MKGFALITGLFLLTSCGKPIYTNRELRRQIVPAGLQDKIWILKKILFEDRRHESLTSEFNNTNGTDNCRFTLTFADKGKLIVTFKEYKYRGEYVMDGNAFKFIYTGFREKIVWTTNPECKITPTQLGLFVNFGRFEFKVEGSELTLTNRYGNKTGATLILTTSL
jgi:hypothetical protein